MIAENNYHNVPASQNGANSPFLPRKMEQIHPLKRSEFQLGAGFLDGLCSQQ